MLQAPATAASSEYTQVFRKFANCNKKDTEASA